MLYALKWNNVFQLIDQYVIIYVTSDLNDLKI